MAKHATYHVITTAAQARNAELVTRMLAILGRGRGDDAVEREFTAVETPTSFNRNDWDWIWSKPGRDVYQFALKRIEEAMAVIYVGEAGLDTWAQVGFAQAKGKLVFGLADNETVGIMSRMVIWADGVDTLDEWLGILERDGEEGVSKQMLVLDGKEEDNGS